MARVLKSEAMGDVACGIRITGDVRNQEPEAVRIVFPGGDVEVTRATDGPGCDYWVHVRMNRPEDVLTREGAALGFLSDARLDQTDKHSNEANLGDFGRRELYHVALRVSRRGTSK